MSIPSLPHLDHLSSHGQTTNDRLTLGLVTQRMYHSALTTLVISLFAWPMAFCTGQREGFGWMGSLGQMICLVGGLLDQMLSAVTDPWIVSRD